VGRQGVHARLSTGYGLRDFAHADGLSNAPSPILRRFVVHKVSRMPRGYGGGVTKVAKQEPRAGATTKVIQATQQIQREPSELPPAVRRDRVREVTGFNIRSPALPALAVQ